MNIVVELLVGGIEDGGKGLEIVSMAPEPVGTPPDIPLTSTM